MKLRLPKALMTAMAAAVVAAAPFATTVATGTFVAAAMTATQAQAELVYGWDATAGAPTVTDTETGVTTVITYGYISTGPQGRGAINANGLPSGAPADANVIINYTNGGQYMGTAINWQGRNIKFTAGEWSKPSGSYTADSYSQVFEEGSSFVAHNGNQIEANGPITANSIWLSSGRYRLNEANIGDVGNIYAVGGQFYIQSGTFGGKVFLGRSDYTQENSNAANAALRLEGNATVADAILVEDAGVFVANGQTGTITNLDLAGHTFINKGWGTMNLTNVDATAGGGVQTAGGQSLTITNLSLGTGTFTKKSDGVLNVTNLTSTTGIFHIAKTGGTLNLHGTINGAERLDFSGSEINLSGTLTDNGGGKINITKSDTEDGFVIIDGALTYHGNLIIGGSDSAAVTKVSHGNVNSTVGAAVTIDKVTIESNGQWRIHSKGTDSTGTNFELKSGGSILLHDTSNIDFVHNYGRLEINSAGGSAASLGTRWKGTLSFTEVTGSGDIKIQDENRTQDDKFKIIFNAITDYDGKIDASVGNGISQFDSIVISNVTQNNGRSAIINPGAGSLTSEGLILDGDGTGSLNIRNLTDTGDLTVTSGTLTLNGSNSVAGDVTIGQNSLLNLNGALTLAEGKKIDNTDGTVKLGQASINGTSLVTGVSVASGEEFVTAGAVSDSYGTINSGVDLGAYFTNTTNVEGVSFAAVTFGNGSSLRVTDTQTMNVYQIAENVTMDHITASPTGNLTIIGNLDGAANSTRVSNWNTESQGEGADKTSGRITIDGNYILSGSADVSNVNGNLLVRGSTTLSNGSTLNVNANGNLTVSGDVDLKQGSNLNVKQGGILTVDRLMVHSLNTSNQETVSIEGGIVNILSSNKHGDAVPNGTKEGTISGLIIGHWGGDDGKKGILNLTNGGVLNALDCTTIVAWDSPGDLKIGSNSEANLYGINNYTVSNGSNRDNMGKVTLDGGRLNLDIGGYKADANDQSDLEITANGGTIGTLTEGHVDINESFTLNGDLTIDTRVHAASTTGKSDVVEGKFGEICIKGVITSAAGTTVTVEGEGTLILSKETEGNFRSVLKVEDGTLKTINEAKNFHENVTVKNLVAESDVTFMGDTSTITGSISGPATVALAEDKELILNFSKAQDVATSLTLNGNTVIRGAKTTLSGTVAANTITVEAGKELVSSKTGGLTFNSIVLESNASATLDVAANTHVSGISGAQDSTDNALHLNMNSSSQAWNDYNTVAVNGLADVYVDSGVIATNVSNQAMSVAGKHTDLGSANLHMADGTSLLVLNGVGPTADMTTGTIYVDGDVTLSLYSKLKNANVPTISTDISSESGKIGILTVTMGGEATLTGHISLDTLKVDGSGSEASAITKITLGGKVSLINGIELTNNGEVSISDSATIDLSNWNHTQEGNTYTYTIITGGNLATQTSVSDKAQWSLAGGTYADGVYTFTAQRDHIVSNNNSFQWGTDAYYFGETSVNDTDNVEFTGSSNVTLTGNITSTGSLIAEGARVGFGGDSGSVTFTNMSNNGTMVLTSTGRVNSASTFEEGKEGTLEIAWSGRKDPDGFVNNFTGDVVVKAGAGILTAGWTDSKAVIQYQTLLVEDGGHYAINGDLTVTGGIKISGNGLDAAADDNTRLDKRGALKVGGTLRIDNKDNTDYTTKINADVTVAGGSASISAWKDQGAVINGKILGEQDASGLRFLNGNSDGNNHLVADSMEKISSVEVERGTLTLTSARNGDGGVDATTEVNGSATQVGDTFTKTGAGKLVLSNISSGTKDDPISKVETVNISGGSLQIAGEMKAGVVNFGTGESMSTASATDSTTGATFKQVTLSSNGTITGATSGTAGSSDFKSLGEMTKLDITAVAAMEVKHITMTDVHIDASHGTGATVTYGDNGGKDVTAIAASLKLQAQTRAMGPVAAAADTQSTLTEIGMCVQTGGSASGTLTADIDYALLNAHRGETLTWTIFEGVNIADGFKLQLGDVLTTLVNNGLPVVQISEDDGASYRTITAADIKPADYNLLAAPQVGATVILQVVNVPEPATGALSVLALAALAARRRRGKKN